MLSQASLNSAPMKKIRLSILTRFYPPDFAATGQLIEELAADLRNRHIAVEIFTGQPGYAFSTKSAPRIERDTDFRLKRSRTSRIWPETLWGKLFNGLFFFLRGAIHLFKAIWFYDLVMLTTEPPYLPILGYFIHRFTKFPYVCLLYDLYPDVAVKLDVLKPSHPLVRLWQWLNYQTWEHAEAIIVLSTSMKAQVLEQCPNVAGKIHVIHSWCDPDLIYPIPKSENWFVQENSLEKTFTVLYSGNLGRCHDKDTILGAAQLLQRAPVKFLFVGGGSKMKACADRATELGLRNCEFLPYQEKKDLAYSLSAADLALVSLDYGVEGVVAPSKLYSLLAAGRPVAAICEPHSYLRKILRDANCGIGIDTGNSEQLADYILDLLKSPEKLDRLGSSGREYFLAHFTLKTIGEQYAAAIYAALGLPPQSLVPKEVTLV
jgi:glycosyltransferase involved in cell wall biosynthesis